MDMAEFTSTIALTAKTGELERKLRNVRKGLEGVSKSTKKTSTGLS